jgi:hypothetical protein
MTGTDGEASRIERPHRQAKPSAVLLAQSNSERATLPSQAKAVVDFRAAPSVASTSHVPDRGKRARVEELFDDEDSEDEERENAYINPKPKGKHGK